MEELDTLLPTQEESQHESLEDLMGQLAPQEVAPLPESATNNRAAILTLLRGDVANVIENYQNMQTEAQLGVSSLADTITQEVEESERESLFQNGVMPILADPSLTAEWKQKALDTFASNKEKINTVSTLTTRALVADSRGESVDSSEARASNIDLFGDMQQAVEREQGLVNSFKLYSADKATVSGTIGELAQEVFIPLADSFNSYQLIDTLNTKLKGQVEFSTGKAVIRPGATMEELRTVYNGMTHRDREIFLTAFIDTIKETQGVIFSSDSQFISMSQLEKLTGDYSAGEAAFDTFVNALDIFGLGYLFKTARGAKKAAGELPTPSATTPTPAGSLATPDPKVAPITVASNAESQKKLDALYAERSDLLVDNSKILPNGSVTRINSELEVVNQKLDSLMDTFKTEAKSLQIRKKMSRKEAESAVQGLLGEQRLGLEATKSRLESMLEANRVGSKAQERLKTIDTEITKLENAPYSNTVLKVNPIIDSVNRIERNSLVAVENPASPGSIFLRSNPQQAQSILKAVYDDVTDTTANAAFGMPRKEVMGMMLAPKQITESGAVTARTVGGLDSINTPLKSEVDAVLASKGASDLTARERIAAGDKIVNDFKYPSSIKVVDGMHGIKVNLDNDTVSVSSVYGSTKGSFSDPEDALRQAQLALRDYGDLSPHMSVMKRQGLDYIPVDLKTVKGVKGDYLVRIEMDRPISRADLPKDFDLDTFGLNGNWLDSIPSFVSEYMGSLTRHLLNASSIFAKELTTAASVADALTVRLEKVLQKNLNTLVKDVKTLPKAHRDALTNYWVRANEEGIPFNAGQLMADGFTAPMVRIAANWRDYWDTIYKLENMDMAKTLRKNGFQLFDNNKDRFFAKPIPKSIREARVYDPDIGEVVVLSRAEMDELYAKGGTFAELKSPFDMDGREVRNILVRNSPDSFIRNFSDTDRVLNYREGYFQTSYKAPIFIDRINPKTKETVAVATAKDSREAEQWIKKASEENPGFEYNSRLDKKNLPGQKQDVWDLNHQGGRTAQRRRGEPLVEAEGSNQLGGSRYFHTPIEAAVRASSSIAGRTIYRDLIDTMKARAMQKHGDLFPRDATTGVKKFPSTLKDISDRGNPYDKKVRDARTDFGYIHYLENGYINGLDNLFKNLVNATALATGKAATKLDSKVLSAVERGLHHTASTPVTGLGKGIVFNAYIATSVFRQWLIQPAQLVRLYAYDPLGAHQALRFVSEYAYSLSAGSALTPKGKQFTKFLDDSGVLDSVDKSNLVRGTLMTSGEQASWWQKTGGRITEPLRVAGYDTAEKINLIGHMGVVFNKYLKEGKNVNSLVVRQEMLGKARSLSYSMDFSGDMPYNQNFLALFTQFLQVPHKALLQPFDRRLSAGERARLFTGDMLMYGAAGTPIVMAANALFGEEFLDENPELKEVLVEGALQVALNSAFEEVLGVTTGPLDIQGSMSPFEYGGFAKLVEELATDGGFAAALNNTPIGGLVLKEGNRFQQAVGSLGRFFGMSQDIESHPETVWSVLNSIASISSGWNNIQKAMVAKEVDKVMSRSGITLKDGVSTGDAIAIALGVQPLEVSRYYEASMAISKDSKDYREHVEGLVKSALQIASGKTNLGVTDLETYQIAMSLIMSEVRNSPEGWQIANNLIAREFQDPQSTLKNRALEAFLSPWRDIDIEATKRAFPEGPEKEKITQWARDIRRKYDAAQTELKD